MTTIARAMNELRNRLKGISKGAGFRTDLGTSVREGFARHLILRQQVDPPLLALHPTTDATQSRQGQNAKAARVIDAELIFDPHESSFDWTDEVLFDVRAALVGLERDVDRVISVETGEVQWQDIEDTHVVRMIVPITVTYSDSYGVD